MVPDEHLKRLVLRVATILLLFLSVLLLFRSLSEVHTSNAASAYPVGLRLQP